VRQPSWGRRAGVEVGRELPARAKLTQPEVRLEWNPFGRSPFEVNKFPLGSSGLSAAARRRSLRWAASD